VLSKAQVDGVVAKRMTTDPAKADMGAQLQGLQQQFRGGAPCVRGGCAG
jgi:hypothetical protein